MHILTRHEVIEDPNDFLVHLLVQSAQQLVGDASTKIFGAVFLLWHGAVKVGLVWALLRRTLSLLDMVVIVLTWLEYQRLARESRLRGAHRRSV